MCVYLIPYANFKNSYFFSLFIFPDNDLLWTKIGYEVYETLYILASFQRLETCN